MTFWITIKNGYRNHQLKVEQIELDSRTEHFKIIGHNKSIVLESNRPLFRNRGLKHRKPDFKIVEGKVKYGGSIDILVTAIMDKIEPKKI